jgi:hypothetical protein
MDNYSSYITLCITLCFETLHYKKSHPPTFNDLVRLGSQRFYGRSEPPPPLHEFGLHRLPNARENPIEANNRERERNSRPYILSLCEIPLHSHYFALVKEVAYDDENPESDLLISRSLCLKVCDKLRPAGGGAE